MKAKDVAVIGFIVIFAAVISYVASGALFKAKTSQDEAEQVAPISAQFSDPDKRFFNSNSYDPTQTITIGNNDNSTPFNGVTSSATTN